MPISIDGFRRPKSISILNRCIACLTENPNSAIYFFLDKERFISKKIEDFGIKEAQVIELSKNKIFILGNIDREIFIYDFNFDFFGTIKLPGKSYGALKFDHERKNLYLSINDLSLIVKINIENLSVDNVFSFKDIKGCENVNSMAINKNRFLFIDTANHALFDIRVSDNNIRYKKYLNFGRGGKGLVRMPTDVNFTDESISINDNNNYLIQFFDLNLKFVYQIGSKGEKLNQFDLPVSSYYQKNSLYVCDQNNDRISVIDCNLKKVRKIIIKDQFKAGSLKRPSGLAIDSRYNILITDRGNSVIQKFSKDLKFISIIKAGNKKFERPSSLVYFQGHEDKYIAIIERKSGKDCTLNIYSYFENKNNLCHKYTLSISESLNDPQDMAITNSGFLVIADTLNRRIVKINIIGKEIKQVNMAKISQNNRILIKTVFVRDDNQIFTADFDKCIIYQLDTELNLTRVIDLSSIKKRIKVIRSVCAFNEHLVIGVRGSDQIIKINFKGEVLKKISSTSKQKIDWNHPVKIIPAPDNCILIADKERDRIVKLSSKLQYISETLGS